MVVMTSKEEETEKWVTHYSSFHQILLVGDGDFSFTLSLASSFGSALNITATSLDSYDTLTKKYKEAKSNLEALQQLGAVVIHGVDATRMKLHTDLKMRRFDRIVYNFPHAGFHGKEDSLRLINKHRGLVQGFFHNASGMLRPNGEIHVSHKTSAPFCDWNLEELASQDSLMLIEAVPFNLEDYPGYNNKRGDGSRCDEPFPLGECSTFKFILVRGCKKMVSHTSQRSSRHVLGDQFQFIQQKEDYHPNIYGLEYHDTGYHTSERSSRHLLGGELQLIQQKEGHHLDFYGEYHNRGYHSVDHMAAPERERFKEECTWIFDGYFNHVRDTFGLPDARIEYSVHEDLSRGYDKFANMASDRPLSDFTLFLEEIHRLSILRIAWLEGILAGIH